jgi:prepilin-type N-terminal cleavage/methylation domain-containing protein/prepilin-type processing-associated H-X9-DG protein
MNRPVRGFTLVELLVVIALIAGLSVLVMVGVTRGLSGGRRANCQQNLRNLAAANEQFALANRAYAPAAIDLMTTNRRRWHGERTSGNKPFDGRKGPLAPFLDASRQVRACPEFARGTGFKPGFEASNGGYGYNAIGIGSRSYLDGYNAAAFRMGVRPSDVNHPSQTLMFADAAFPQPYANPTHLIEYSFAEPVRHLAWNTTQEAGRADASIHFRHGRQASVIWLDGHLSAEPINPSASPSTEKFSIGWFGEPADNTPFRPF